MESSGKARIEDLHVWEMRRSRVLKPTYWMPSWLEGEKVRKVYLRSIAKLSRKEALEKAERLRLKH